MRKGYINSGCQHQRKEKKGDEHGHVMLCGTITGIKVTENKRKLRVTEGNDKDGANNLNS